MYKAFTDTRVVLNKSFHSFVIFDIKGKFIDGKVIESNKRRSTDAEIYTIELLLEYMIENNYKNGELYTDSQTSITSMDKYFLIPKYLKMTNSKLLWIERNKNKIAHNACSSGDIEFFSKPYDIVLIKNRLSAIFKPRNLTKNDISHTTTSKEDRFYMMYFYSVVTNTYNAISIDDVFHFAKDRYTKNTELGREYLIRELIENQYEITYKSHKARKIEKEINLKDNMNNS